MTNVELLSTDFNYIIGSEGSLQQVLANVISIGNVSKNVTLSLPQDISTSYNLILPERSGTNGEVLVYDTSGQLKWQEINNTNDTNVLKQVVSVFGNSLNTHLVEIGRMSNVVYPANYQASITPTSINSKIFVQFKINFRAALSSNNQIDFYIRKIIGETTTELSIERLNGTSIGTGGLVGQYISNLLDVSTTTEEITYQVGFMINGHVDISEKLGILGYDNSYNNTLVLQEYEGSGSNSISVWNKGSDNQGLYYNSGTVHIGSANNALNSQSSSGDALQLSGNLVGINANFSGEINTDTIKTNEGYFSGEINANTIKTNEGYFSGEINANTIKTNEGYFSGQINANTIKTNEGYFSSIITLLNLDTNGDKSVSLSIAEDISSSYNLILPKREGISGEILVYGNDGQLIWDDLKLKQETFIYINGNNNEVNYLNNTNSYNLYSSFEMNLDKITISAPYFEFFTDTNISRDNKTLLITSNGLEINTKNNETISLGTINGKTGISATNNLILDSSNTTLFNVNNNNLMTIYGNGNIDINANVNIDKLLNHKGVVLNEILITSFTPKISSLPLDSIIKVEGNLTYERDKYVTFLSTDNFLVGGSYLIQIYINDNSDNNSNNDVEYYDSYYTGLMSWPYNDTAINRENIQKICLHNCYYMNDETSEPDIKLQTKTIIGSTILELQIAHTIMDTSSNLNFTFKARKVL